MIMVIDRKGAFDLLDNFKHVRILIEVMMPQVHFDIAVRNHGRRVNVNLHLNIRLDVSKACKLIEMPSESIPGMIESLIASRNETSSLYKIMPLVEGRSREVLVNRVNFKFLKGINGCDGVLPNVANNVVKIPSFEHIHRIRRHPIFHVNIANLLVLPTCLIFRE